MKELDMKSADYIKEFMSTTLLNIDKQATINKDALVKRQRKLYYLVVSAVIAYILATLLGVS